MALRDGGAIVISTAAANPSGRMTVGGVGRTAATNAPRATACTAIEAISGRTQARACGLRTPNRR